MAASGAQASSTINIPSSIYAKMEPIEAKKKLMAALRAQYAESHSYPQQLWLLRESRVDGCLTLSYIVQQEDSSYKDQHRRYALVKTNEDTFAWVCVSDDATLHALQQEEKIIFMNMYTARKEENLSFCDLLFDTFKATGFLPEYYLDPSQQESSRNSVYINISRCTYIQNQLETEPSKEILEKLEHTTRMLAEQHEDQTCPITFEKPEGVAGISQTPHLYHLQALENWVNGNGSDPMTRASITVDNILPTHAPQKMHTALEEVTRRIAMCHAKSS